jgi:hypothetical protein
MGFDCRTPICEQGYYKSNTTAFVEGQNTTDVWYEYDVFDPFMANTTLRLSWPYANPNYSIQIEFYENESIVRREIKEFPPRKKYLGPVHYSSQGDYQGTNQGGYRCSIRAWTEWEHENYTFQHPNYYSQYMERHRQDDGVIYSNWTRFGWPDTHRKSRVLDYVNNGIANRTFAYTNQGWKRTGIWNKTHNTWEFGICFLEFWRNCSQNSLKAFDLFSNISGFNTLDPDLSFRPRVYYTDERVISHGRWKESTGQCIDQVIRGCANNGTCVAPNKCRCGEGWSGEDCKVPICQQKCHHEGNCTSPNVCTCEKGWRSVSLL